MSGNQRQPLAANPGAGVGYHGATRGTTAIQSQPAAVANVTLQQVLVSAVTTFTIQTPALAQGATADVSFTQSLGLAGVTLQTGARGVVRVTLDLAEQPAGLQVTFSRQLQYGGTSPQNVWTLPAGATFNGGKVVGVARLYALAAVGAQTLTVVMNADVLGIPPPGGS